MRFGWVFLRMMVGQNRHRICCCSSSIVSICCPILVPPQIGFFTGIFRFQVVDCSNFLFSLLNTQLQMRQHEPTATTLTTNIQPDDNTILNANGGGHCGNYCKVKLIEGGGHHNQMLVNHWTQSGLPNGHITIQNAMKRKSNSSKDDSRWGTDWIIQYSSLKCASIEEQPRHIKSSGK